MPTDAQVHPYDLKNINTPSRLKSLWRLLTGFRLSYLGATLSIGLAATAKTGTYLLLRYFIDNFFVETGQSINLVQIALAFVGLALTEGTFTFLSGRLAARTAEGITRRLRNYLFDHIQHLTFAYHSKTQTGELIQRVTSDVDAIRRFFSDQAIGVGRIILLFVINFIAIFNLHPLLAFLSIIVIPLVLVVSMQFFKRITKAYEDYQNQDGVLTTILQENLSGVRVVKAFARQEYEITKFEKENWEKFRRGKKLMSIHSLFWPVSDLLCSAQMLAGYLIGALMAINGEISVGTYLAYAGLLADTPQGRD
ncbi:MAG TPA: ABC transporter ATP-binding protein, partial [Anaerolineaceae bacterium]|nr:ABC transporter ATP-binding protein [Anaerolineaceae bacterium]